MSTKTEPVTFTQVELRMLLHLVNKIFIDNRDTGIRYIPPPHMARLIDKLERLLRETHD